MLLTPARGCCRSDVSAETCWMPRVNPIAHLPFKNMIRHKPKYSYIYTHWATGRGASLGLQGDLCSKTILVFVCLFVCLFCQVECGIAQTWLGKAKGKGRFFFERMRTALATLISAQKKEEERGWSDDLEWCQERTLQDRVAFWACVWRRSFPFDKYK